MTAMAGEVLAVGRDTRVKAIRVDTLERVDGDAASRRIRNAAEAMTAGRIRGLAKRTSDADRQVAVTCVVTLGALIHASQN